MRRAVVIAVLAAVLCLAVFAVGVDDYCYSRLSVSEQIAYDAMFDCITTLTPKWNCGSFSQDTLKKAYDCLMLDHPELYWSESFTYVTSFVNNAIAGRSVEFEYTMTRSRIEQTNREIEKALFDIMREIGTVEPSYETVRLVYRWMVENCTYDVTNMDQSMYSVMVGRSGVCASFSKAFEFIMQCLGIPCTCVNGRLRSGSGILGSGAGIGHEWNLVFIDGVWSHVDVTSAVGSSEDGFVDYGFFCCTTEEISRTHTIDNVVDIPVCNDPSLGVYRRYGLVLDGYDRDAVASAFSTAQSLGMLPEVRFSSYRAFLDAKEDLIDRAGLFQVVEALGYRSLGSIDYSIDEGDLSIRLHNAIGL